jgi:hypothetical protein
MKTAAEYAKMAQENIISGTLCRKRRDAEACQRRAIAWATLANAAATLEAARLMGPTPQEQVVLDALTAPMGTFEAAEDNPDEGEFEDPTDEELTAFERTLMDDPDAR